MKILKFYTVLSLNIIALFAIAILYSFLTDYLRSSGFFGDELNTSGKRMGFGIDDKWEWGTRHYLWFWMSVLLFLTQMVRTIHFMFHKAEKEFSSKIID